MSRIPDYDKIYAGRKPKGLCDACGEPAFASIELVRTNDGLGRIRYYLPNQSARNRPHHHSDLQEVYFCPWCMRVLEDNFRATVLYLSHEAEGDRLRKEQLAKQKEAN